MHDNLTLLKKVTQLDILSSEDFEFALQRCEVIVVSDRLNCTLRYRRYHVLLTDQGLLSDSLARDQAATSWDVIASIAHYLDSSWGLLWLFTPTLKGGVSSAIGDGILVTSCSTWIHS